jgi:hypothetical protein
MTMKITESQANRLNALLTVAREYLEEIGGCDHSVNICSCGLAREIEQGANALHELTDGKFGNAPLPEPENDPEPHGVCDTFVPPPVPKAPARPHEAFRFVNETFAQCDVPSFMAGHPLEMD